MMRFSLPKLQQGAKPVTKPREFSKSIFQSVLQAAAKEKPEIQTVSALALPDKSAHSEIVRIVLF